MPAISTASLTAVVVAVGSLATALVTTPLASRIGRRLGVIAEPTTGPPGLPQIPVFGGASIMAGILLALGLLGGLSTWLAVGAGALFVVGAVDDAIALRPRQKLVFQLVIVLWAVGLALPRFHLAPWPAVDFALTVFWLIAAINAFNLIDGIDGLAAGIGIIASLALATIGLLRHDHALLLESLAVGGALGGFLVFNFPPASIFMGDAGTLPVGFILGVLALRGGDLANSTRLARLVFPVLVMLVPLLDTAIVTVTRLATGNAISRHGTDHSHHRLLALGLDGRRVTAVCWAVAALGAGCAVAADLLPHAYIVAALPFIALATAVIALFMMDLTFDGNPPGLAYGYLQGFARFLLSLGYKRRVAEAAVDFALISAAYFGAAVLRADFALSTPAVKALLATLPAVALLTYVAFLLAGIYRGIWRYTGLSDGIRFANGAALAGLFMAAGSFFLPMPVSGSIVVLYAILLFNLLVATRVSFQALRKGIAFLAAHDQRVLVIGAGEEGAAAANFIASHRDRGVRLIGFVDEDGFKRGKLVHGQRVLGVLDDLGRIHDATPFQQVMVAAELSGAQRERLSAFAEPRGIAVRRFSIQLDEMSANGSTSGRGPTAGAALRIGAPRAV
jgi:UDP-GlcNAc:undecaprenyl-phosphate/decaprenyl-phosphate GlcNAc-1-phosphate transferase